MQAVEWIVARLDRSRDQLFLELFAQDFPKRHRKWRPSQHDPQLFCLKFLEKRETRNGIREHFFNILVVPSSSRGIRAVAQSISHQVQCKRHVITRTFGGNQLEPLLCRKFFTKTRENCTDGCVTTKSGRRKRALNRVALSPSFPAPTSPIRSDDSSVRGRPNRSLRANINTGRHRVLRRVADPIGHLNPALIPACKRHE